MMYLLNRKKGFLAGLTLCFAVIGHTQTVTSIRDGLWSDPSVWDTGQVPTLATASETVINHAVILPAASVISIQNAVVNNSFTVEAGAVVNLVPDALPLKKDLQVFGTLVLQDGSTLTGTSVSNTSFESGSRYIHLQGPLGFIPYAAWDANSTFEITGFKAQGYINIAHSDSWKQNFGHVLYNCTQQTTPFVDLNGYLRNIAGNFRVQSTNGQALRLSTTQNSPISIGGDFIVEGPSRIWLSTSPSAGLVNVQGNLIYRSTASGISYLTTKGVMIINVHGNFEINTPGRIHMASTSLDSTGIRQTILALRGGFSVVSGLVVGPPLPAKGRIAFLGSGVQAFSAPLSPSFQGSIDFIVETGSTLNLGTSFLSNSAGDLVVKGRLQLGSPDPQGAIQLSGNGNVRTVGNRTFEPGSTIEYNGLAGQLIGNGHPSLPGVNLICNNPAGVTMLKEIAANDVTILGNFSTQSFPLTVYGNLTMAPAIECTIEHINLQGGLQQQVSAGGATFKNLVIDKFSNGARLVSPLKISQSVLIKSTNTTLYSDGNLTLLSTSDLGPGTSGIGPLPTGSSIDGDVTVHRHMDAEGRIYRYISSPVQNSSIASLKDDFPITGRFQDPSGSGLRSTSPSFYYYDESRGSLQDGWMPYPTSGFANANPLVVGKGYAAYIQGGNSITWDVTGPLNHGTLSLPVSFTPNNQPANGWNLVGNPYACAILWDETGVDKWSRENISSVIAVRDNGVGGGTFRYWDIGDDGQIATGQAFWVRATNNNPKLTIREGVKVTGGAAFYRKERPEIPGFSIELSRDSLTDVAYFKIRSTAKPGIDDWDGVKLDNVNFDISFISSDHKSLAIAATNQFPCDTIIQIGFKDLLPGWYKFRLIAKYDFSTCEFTLLDKFLHTETILRADQTIPLVVTADPASYAFDRISLRVVERKLTSGIEISGDKDACIGSVVNLLVKHVQPNVVYSLWADSLLLTSTKSEDEDSLQFSFRTDRLQAGHHYLRLQAQSNCNILPRITEHALTVDVTPEVRVDSIGFCPGSSAKLSAFTSQTHVLFHWFVDEKSGDTLATGNQFDTPVLIKPQVFYVSATTPSGCSSNRYPLKVYMMVNKVAEISVSGDSLLLSNFRENNTWYLDDVKLDGETGYTLPLNHSGEYVLRVDTLGCISEDRFENILLNTEPPSEIFYPNPVRETLLIRDTGNVIKRLEIFDTSGKRVTHWEQPHKIAQSLYSIDVSYLPEGTYVGILTTSHGKRVVRFGKKRR